MKKIILSAILLMFAFLSSGYALSGYQYYRDITLDNTGNSNTLTNYQVMITIDTASLISQGKLNNDCSDIRFTEADGITELSYWIEDGTCNTASTNIWVKVPSIPGSSTYTIQLWYGNPSATSASNIDNVFIFGDDFRSGTLDTTKWQTSSGEGSISISSDDKLIVSSTGDSPYVATQSAFSYPIVVEWKSSVSALDQLGGIGLVGSVGDMVDNQLGGELAFRDSDYRVTSGRIIVYNDSTIFYVLDNYGQDNLTYHRHKIVWSGAGYSAFYMDNNLLAEHTTNPTANQYFEVSTRYRTADYTHYLDWVIIRAYANPEPTTAVGEEKIYSNSPIITITDPSSSLYYGIDKVNISFSVMDFDNSTLNVYAYVNGTEIYANNAYANNTAVSLQYNVKGYFYNISVVADDGISKVYSERIVHVFYGVNITSNTQGFDLTIEIGGVNTTYTGIDYKVIEWNEVGNNSIARVWVTKPGFDVAYKQILFNDSMGFWNEIMEIYTAHTFYIKDENGDYIKDWILTLNGTKAYSTNDYEIKVSTRGLEEGYYLLNATALGYEYRTAILELNNSYRVNYTFTTKQNSFIINVYDEETADMVKNTTLNLYYNDVIKTYYNNKSYTGEYTVYNYVISAKAYYAVDYDYTSAFYCSDGDSTAYGYCEAVYEIGVVKGDKGKLCIKYKGDILGTSGDYYSISLQIYNETSGSWNEIYTSGYKYDSNIYEGCGTYDNTNNDYGQNAKVKVRATGYNYVDFYIYEIYEKNAVGRNKYVFNFSEVSNLNYISLEEEQYAKRRYYVDIPQYSSLTLDAYLLKKSSGMYYVFTVVDASTSYPLPNTLITVAKMIGNVYKTVEQIKTNPDGTGTLFLKPNDEYRVAFINPDYVTGYYTFIPSPLVTNMQVKLNKSAIFNVNISTILEGVSYRVLPEPGLLEIPENASSYPYNFSLSVYSSKGNLKLFGMSLYCNGALVYAHNETASPAGGEIRYALDVASCDNIENHIFIETDKGLFYMPYKYYVSKSYDIGLSKAVNELKKTYNDFQITLLVVIFLIAIASLLSIVNPYVAFLGVLAVESLLTYVGLMNFNIFVIAFLISVAVIFIMSRLRV